MFINYSNHPSSLWGEQQKKAAQQYGEIIDIPFPIISVTATAETLKKLASEDADKILSLHPSCVMCQGEMTFTHALVNFLLDAEINVVAACSSRKTTERVLEDGKVHKATIYEFSGFRRYF